MSDCKRPAALRGAVAKKQRSLGFATRDQRLPASPPLLSSASAASGNAPGFIAAVRARYRDALDLLFGTPPRVLNASCGAPTLAAPTLAAPTLAAPTLAAPTLATRPHIPHPAPHEQAPLPVQRRYPKRRRQTLAARHPEKRHPAHVKAPTSVKAPVSDQVVPGFRPAPAPAPAPPANQDLPCEGLDVCHCSDELWTAGGVGPELMLRTAEELSERILILYGKAVDPHSSGVDYSSLVHSKDFHQYLKSARKLRYFDPLLLNDSERKAFFLNVYNSLMIHAIAVMSKPRTMFERVSLYNTAAYDIGGRPYSLNMIEHGVLRVNRPGCGPFAQAPFADNDARKLCVLPTVDPRIHFALNCGARSCPAVRFYEADSLDRTLDSATHVYLQEMEADIEKRVITLPKLLKWYRADFSADGGVDSLIKWTLPYLESQKRDLVNTLLQEKEQGLGTFTVAYAGYDWTVNDSSS